MLLLLLGGRTRLRTIGAHLGPAIEELMRGGPRPPSHPIPGNDSWFLTRRRRKDTESL
jgi:hypothetical protein